MIFSSTSQTDALAGSLLIAGAVSYGFVALTTLFSLPLRTLHRSRDPSEIWGVISDGDVESIEDTFRDWARETNAENRRVLRLKQAALIIVMAFCAIEVLAVAGAAISIHLS